jgi:tRNA wybutosine-synthesizing protein 3
MPRDIFLQRKKDVLSKKDKSSKARQSLLLNRPSVANPKASWDKKISDLCKKINSLDNYYTTSSCSGRIVLMINQDKKEKDLFFNVYHDLISFNKIKKDLECIFKKNKESIKLKLEPCALHVACRTLEDAQNFYNNVKLAGWKKFGVISFGHRFIVELTSTERLEFPIINSGKILVNDEFLKIIVDESNKKLKKGWLKIQKLHSLI